MKGAFLWLTVLFSFSTSDLFCQTKIHYFSTDLSLITRLCPNVSFTTLNRKSERDRWKGFSATLGYQIRATKEMGSQLVSGGGEYYGDWEPTLFWVYSGIISRLEYQIQIKKNSRERMLYLGLGSSLKYLVAKNAYTKFQDENNYNVYYYNYLDQTCIGIEPYVNFGIKASIKRTVIDFEAGSLCAFHFRERNYLTANPYIPLNMTFDKTTINPGVLLQFRIGLLSSKMGTIHPFGLQLSKNKAPHISPIKRMKQIHNNHKRKRF